MSCFLSNSSLGKKLVMSVTGCFLVLFLLFHMSMNIVAIISPEAYNMICALLGANWYALAGTLVLAAGSTSGLKCSSSKSWAGTRTRWASALPTALR